MPTLFPTRPGQSIALDVGDGDLGLPLIIDGIRGSWFPTFRSILTEFSAQFAGNNQFTHTFGNVIYAYSFGDRITQLRIGGLTLAGGCDGGDESGLEAMLAFYRENRMAVRQKPIQIQVGTRASGRFRGYLTEFQPAISRPEARIGQFALLFKVM